MPALLLALSLGVFSCRSNEIPIGYERNEPTSTTYSWQAGDDNYNMIITESDGRAATSGNYVLTVS